VAVVISHVHKYKKKK